MGVKLCISPYCNNIASDYMRIRCREEYLDLKEETGGWRKNFNKEFCNLYPPLNIIRMINQGKCDGRDT
jgi:hypothetical protein